MGYTDRVYGHNIGFTEIRQRQMIQVFILRSLDEMKREANWQNKAKSGVNDSR